MYFFQSYFYMLKKNKKHCITMQHKTIVPCSSSFLNSIKVLTSVTLLLLVLCMTVELGYVSRRWLSVLCLFEFWLIWVYCMSSWIRGNADLCSQRAQPPGWPACPCWGPSAPVRSLWRYPLVWVRAVRWDSPPSRSCRRRELSVGCWMMTDYSRTVSVCHSSRNCQCSQTNLDLPAYLRQRFHGY